jgi:hypothetical protein
MNRARCRSLALTALLCGGGPVVADDESRGGRAMPRPEQAVESDGLWLNPALAREQSVSPSLQLTSHTEIDLARSFVGEPLGWGNNRFSVPLQQETWRLDTRRSLLVNALAIEWQHSMNAANLLAFSARYGDSLYSDPTAMDGGSAGNAGAVFRPELPGASGTAATLSWSTLFGGESRVIGRLYVGDEETKERSNGNSDHRYYGLHLEGRYGLWRDHTPFASLKWQRGNYEAQDSLGPAGSLLRRENFSHLGAGWNWQVSPSWDVRAEANYRLADDSVDVPEFDRTQLYFSTHYGFR